jgi:hypothetical protein
MLSGERGRFPKLTSSSRARGGHRTWLLVIIRGDRAFEGGEDNSFIPNEFDTGYDLGSVLVSGYKVD